MKNIIVKMLSPSYDKLEDRIRLAINYQDIENRIDFMITRAYLFDFLNGVDQYIHTYYSDFLEQSLNPMDIIAGADINKDQKKQKTNISSQTNRQQNPNEQILSHKITHTKQEDIELCKTFEDLLVSVRFTYNQENRLTSIVFISKENYHARLETDVKTLIQFIEALKHSAPKLQWGISLNL